MLNKVIIVLVSIGVFELLLGLWHCVLSCDRTGEKEGKPLFSSVNYTSIKEKLA